MKAPTRGATELEVGMMERYALSLSQVRRLDAAQLERATEDARLVLTGMAKRENRRDAGLPAASLARERALEERTARRVRDELLKRWSAASPKGKRVWERRKARETVANGQLSVVGCQLAVGGDEPKAAGRVERMMELARRVA